MHIIQKIPCAAKYHHSIDVQAFERNAWTNGIPTNDGKGNKVFDFGKIVGARSGVETQYVIIKNSANTIHGHPITPEEFKALIKK